MDHATQVALARRLIGFLDRGTTEMAAAPCVNPVEAYTSPARLDHERRELFCRQPLFVGLTCDIAAPGAYLVHDDTGVPILITRTQAGELRACLPLCRHRGAQVVTGAGIGNGRFTCPYHGWTYGEDGRLLAQPCREGFTGLDPEALGLKPLAVVERYGLVFARATAGDPIDVEAHLAGAERELAPLGLEQYVLFARHRTERALNWKLVIDTFLEAYHVPTVHPQSLGGMILGSPAAWDPFGRGGRMVATRRSVAELRDRPEAEWNLPEHSVVLYHLFPNTMLIHQIDHIEVVQVYPGSAGADSAKVVFSFYTPAAVTTPGAQRHFQRNYDLLLDTIEREDFPLAEGIQRGFHADPTGRVIYGRNEPGVAHFQRMVRAALGLADLDPSA
jgi:phenylpropionate dioxygenase-like ring-hydroxylating dioxygenase large terminal subunit